MRSVLYSSIDLEPITVFEVPDWLLKFGRKHRRFSVNVPAIISPVEPVQFLTRIRATIPWYPPVVDIELDIIRMFRGGKYQEQVLLYTADEEAALLLRPELLPGQQRIAQEKFKEGFAVGFLDALDRLSEL